MRYRQAPPDFVCLYRNACPHMDGISARWAFSVFREQWRVKDQVRILERDNEQLRAQNDELIQERDRIQAQYQALHRSQFKAAKTKPPPDAAAESATPKKRGPPKGHPPWNRRQPGHIDRVVPVPAPTICPHCHCSALLPSPGTLEHIQEDIVLQPRTHVTRFDHAMAFCPKCRRPVYDTGPGELRNASIGPVTKATAVWLHHGLKLPFRIVRELFSTLFAMSFVPASALNFSLAAARKGQPLYADLKEKLRAALLLHLDETSWRIDGDSAWLWYAGNQELDFFHVARSRATEVLLDILGGDYRGDFVSDDYAVYNFLLARWRQTCLAHLIRTAKDIAAEIRLLPDAAPYAQDLSFANSIAEFFSEVCRLDHQRRAGKLPRKKARALIPTLRRRLKALCAAARLTHPKTLNLRDRLLDVNCDANRLFTFLARPGMPPTNNLAERALRGPVIARTISFGSRSDHGAHAFALLASLLGTAKRQACAPLSFLHTLFTADTASAKAMLFPAYANTS